MWGVTMAGWQTIFADYGADYAATMGRFMGNEALYLRLLGMLFQDDTLEQLGAALDADDRRRGFEAAHTLKGVASNLGLTPLCRALELIVEPLRAGEERGDYPTLYHAVRREFQRAEAFRAALTEGGRA